jgi:hypothetical protein
MVHEPSSEAKAKSLYLCLALENPFDPRYEFRNRTIPESTWKGYPATKDNPATYLSDSDYLLQYSRPSPRAPTRFQKIIDMLIRFRKRGIYYEPAAMLEMIPEGEEPIDDTVSSSGGPVIGPCTNPTVVANSFHGWRLVESELLKSPDEDEIYIKIYCPKKTLLAFAERQGEVLPTNPFSYVGGAPMAYTAASERALSDSVARYMLCYPDDVTARYKGKKKPWGFLCEVPQKMKLFVKYLTEAWQFGGCGLRVDEMKSKGIFVIQFFPLHNEAAFQSLGLDQWASFRGLLAINPWKMNEDAVVQYFGPKVGLYFVWLRSYTLLLAFPSLLGAIAGIVMILPVSASIVNGLFAGSVVLWAVAWSKFWDHREKEFLYQCHDSHQETQELVREQFKPDRVADVSAQKLFRRDFSYPLTLRRKPDGTMVELKYNTGKRLLMRACLTYPVIIVLSAGMLAVLTSLTTWRLQYAKDKLVEYGSSVIAVVVSVIFGLIFDFLVPKLNALENNRTESEEETQYIIKSMLFYFPNSYFALFALALTPPDAPSNPSLTPEQNIALQNELKLQLLSTQMLVITVVKPLFLQLQEYLTPILLGMFRRRRDKTGSICKAICSMLCCKRLPSPPSDTDAQRLGKELWKMSQKEPYMSTASDFLLITLQFGYMAMFAAVFPWGPLACLVYNTIEIRSDAKRLYFHTQRPFSLPTGGIGPWKNMFWLFTGLSVVTNSFLIAQISPVPKNLGFGDDETARLKCFFALQYILVGIIALICIVVNSHSTEVLKDEAKQHLFSDIAIRHRISQLLEAGIAQRQDELINGPSDGIGVEGGTSNWGSPLAQPFILHPEVL